VVNGNDGLRVLVVDDQPAILRTLSGLLQLNGYACETATDPAAALERLDQEDFHIIVTDIVMPKMGGLEFIRRVRERGSYAEIVLITAHSTLDRAAEAHRLGASGYLLKPFDNLGQVLSVVALAERRFRLWRDALVRTVAP
jgi:DNA-binding NtrC family response regulator